MQTGYFVHKVLVICKLLKLTWSCCLLPSALGRLGIVWEGRFKPVTFPSFQHRVVWSHLTRTSSIFAIVVLFCFLLLLLTFCNFRCGIFGTTMWLLLLLFLLFLPLVIVLLLPQVSRPGGSPRPELRAWLLWRLQVKRPIHGHPVRISAICRVYIFA